MAGTILSYPLETMPHLKGADVASAKVARSWLSADVVTAVAQWSKELFEDPSWPRITVRGACGDGALDQPPIADATFTSVLARSDGAAVLCGCSRDVAAGALCGLLRTPKFVLNGAPTAEERGLLLFCLSHLLAHVPGMGEWSVFEHSRPTDLFAERNGAAKEVVVLTFDVDCEPASGTLWLAVPTMLMQPANRPRSCSRHAAVDAIEVETAVTCAKTTLPAKAVAALGCDDIIVFDGCPRQIAAVASATLTANGVCWPVTCDDGTIKINGTAKGEDVMPDGEQAADEIQVDVRVELGQIKMSVGELHQLAEGDVIAFGRAPREMVDVRAGGKRIARGELVDVDGEAGVRLVEFYD